MAQMKALAIELRQRRASCAVLVPFRKTRFYKSRAVALAVVNLQRAIGRPAFIFPEN